MSKSLTSTVPLSDSTRTELAPSRKLRWFARGAALLWWGSLAMAVVLAVAWTAIYILIVPRIGQLRPQLENRLSATLGVPLRIGKIDARIQGLMPTFEMRQVRLLDAQGRDALVLQTVTAAVSPQSLLVFGFEQLLIEQPELAVHRDRQGKITVAGLNMASADPASASVGADWLFAQGEVVVRSGTLRWTDELAGLPAVSLSQVDLQVRNDRRRHQIRLAATPPSTWGQRFTLIGDFRSPLWSPRSSDWRSWQGQVYADFPWVDAQQLRSYALWDVDLKAGHGQLRGWFALDRAKLREATTDVSLADVDIRWKADLQPLLMKKLSGRFSLSHTADRLEMRAQELAFELRDGLRWPAGHMGLTLNDLPAQSHPSGGQLNAQKIDLAALAHIADRLPLDARLHQWLRAVQPQGQVAQLQAAWKGSISAPEQYTLQGMATGIGLRASHDSGAQTNMAQGALPALPWHPGVQNAQLEFKLNEKSGKVQLQVAQGSVSLPGVFEEPTVDLDQLSAALEWQIDGNAVQVQSPKFKFANADAQGEGKFRWQSAKSAPGTVTTREPGFLDLEGSLIRAEGARVHRYLPLWVSPSVRHYVRDAVVQAKLSQGKFKLKGPLQHMPFAQQSQGEFRVSAQVSDAVLDYVPSKASSESQRRWPALENIHGELVFDRQSMAVRGATAQIAGAPSMGLSKLEASIADLRRQPQVLISADARGSAADFLSTIHQSPLRDLTGQALAQTTAQGPADMKLRLVLPLQELQRSQVQGTLTLAGNDVQWSAQAPVLEQVRGQLSFNEKGFVLHDTSARAFGGEVRLEGASRPDAGINDATVALQAQGSLTAQGLRQAKELGYVSRLAMHASGTTTYAASLQMRRGRPEISVTSDLQGMALNLPAPFSKTSNELLPLRYEHRLLDAPSLGGSALMQDQLRLDLGTRASIHYWRDISASVPRVIRGRVGVGLEPGESIAGNNDDPGVAANLRFDQLDLDAWKKILVDAEPPADAEKTVAPSADILAYFPSIMSVRATELGLQGRTLHRVVLGGSREGLNWRANLDSRELNGYLEYRQPSENNAGRVFARLARMSIEAAAASDIEAALDQQPSSIPALDVVVEDFELRGRRLGRLELQAINREGADRREWQLSRLQVSLPEAQLNATGSWVQLSGGAAKNTTRPERRRTQLNFQLDIADSGELLKRFGQDKVLAHGKGVMQGQIAWQGAPWALDYNSMQGGFNVQLQSGQFLQAEPGIAKLLGVLSLQALPRRLALDFRDVFTDGFMFDFIRGDVTIAQGLASTNNLQMKGVNAAVVLEGTADIGRETQDLKVLVVPEINAGTASLVATAINPAIGLGTFLAQLILRRPVIEASTQEFHITGSWAEPQIVRIKRNREPQAKP
jgi:uncharacterized protein (TIGR02099 family)